MKLKKVLLSVFSTLLILGVLAGCGSTQETDSDGKGPLEKLDLALLKKLDKGKEPKFVVALFSKPKETEHGVVDLSAALSEALTQSGRVTVVGRGDAMDGVMREMELSMAGLVQNKDAIGAKLGSEVIVFGRVANVSVQTVDKTVFHEASVQVQIEVQGVKVKDGTVMFSLTATGTSDGAKQYMSSGGELISGNIDYKSMYVQAATRAVGKVTYGMVRTFPLIGKVVKAGEMPMVTIGSAHQAKEGMTVAIVRKGEAIVDGGMVLGYDNTLIGLGTIVKLQNKMSTIQMDGKIAMPIQKGDLAVLND